MALPNPLEAFVWGPGGAQMTPEQIARQREIADALLNQAGDTSPVAHWTQGAARVANALAGKFKEARANKAEAINAEGSQSRIAALLEGMTGGGAAQFLAAPSGGGGAPVAANDAASERVSNAFKPLGQSQEEFVAALMPAAIEASKRTGVDPRIIVAQAAQETGWGKSAPGNNYFGIKSHGQGGGQNLTTHEVINGKRVKIKDSFRQFASPGDSVAGYADFLLQNPRYKPMMAAQGLDAQLQALGASGYATDPNYASSVGAIARGIPMPSAVAANETMATGQPIQTASLDPSIGMGGDVPAEYAATGLSPEQWQTMNAPEGAAPSVPMPAPVEGTGFQVGGAATSTDAGKRVVQALINPQSMTGGAPMPMQGDTQPVPQQVAQAAPAQTPGMNPGMQAAIAQALSNPGASEGEKQIAGLLLKQQLAQMDPANTLDMEYKRAQIAALNAKGSGPAELGLNPQYGVDPDGNPVLIQIGKDGKAVQTAMPEGVRLSKEPIKMDAGTHWVLLDPITRQPVGQIPKENRQAAFDTAVGGAEGKAVGEANVQLPQTIATAEQSIANIDAVINDPNLEYAVGAAGILPAIPGTAQAGTVARIEQLQGAAFLQAFEALKGGGQITEIEGKKATDAIARLSRAQKKEDFLDALSDLRAIVASGLDRARRKGGGAAQPKADKQPVVIDGYTIEQVD